MIVIVIVIVIKLSSNIIMNIFYYITNFSRDMVGVITSYLDQVEIERLDSIKQWVVKELYMLKPGIERIPKYNHDKYIRWIIRGDRDFLFKFTINNIINNNKTRIRYKNMFFKTYIDYIKYLINTYNSGKCKTILTNVKST